MRIELLYFPGCPHAAPARELLRGCLQRLSMDVPIEEITGDHPSPSILIDGEDVMGQPPTLSAACRLDLPTEERVLAVLARRRALDE